MRRTKGALFDLGEIICWISVQTDASTWNEREFIVRPHLKHTTLNSNPNVAYDLCEVERIEFVELGFCECHNLNKELPRRIVAFLDCIEQIADGIICVFA